MKKIIKTMIFSLLFVFLISPSFAKAEDQSQSTEVKLVVPESEKDKLHDVSIYDVSEYFTYDENKKRDEQALALCKKVENLDLTDKFIAKTDSEGEIKVTLNKNKAYFVKGKNIAPFVIIGQTDLTMIPEDGLVVKMKPEDTVIVEKHKNKEDDIPEKTKKKEDDLIGKERVQTGTTGTKIALGILVVSVIGYCGAVLYKNKKEK